MRRRRVGRVDADRGPTRRHERCRRRFAGAFAAGILKGFATGEAAELATFLAADSTTALGGHGPNVSLAELRAMAKAAGFDWGDRL